MLDIVATAVFRGWKTPGLIAHKLVFCFTMIVCVSQSPTCCVSRQVTTQIYLTR